MTTMVIPKFMTNIVETLGQDYILTNLQVIWSNIVFMTMFQGAIETSIEVMVDYTFGQLGLPMVVLIS